MWHTSEMEIRMSSNTPAPTTTTTPPAVPAAAPTTPPVPAKPPTPATAPEPTAPTPVDPPWGKPENFDPAKAWELIQNLRKEKGADTTGLQKQLADLLEAQESQKSALAEALGLKEAPKPEDLAETVKSLQEKFETSQREATKLRVAAEKGVPAEYHHLLTETDMEKLTAQAEMAAEYARLKAQAEGTPAFQPNPGQGQGGQPPTPEALAEAEYQKFYPDRK